MKKARWAQRVRKGLWWAACVVSMGVGYQAQVAADCTDPTCQYTVTVGCVLPCTRSTGSNFSCCCSNGTTGCCQYTCQTVYCNGPASCSTSGNSFWGGARQNPDTCDGTSGKCVPV